MIQINNIDFKIGTKELFQNASAQISPGQKVGLVGRNGCGKSTLFSLLTGVHVPDHGEISIPQDWKIASVAQETPALDTPAIDYVIAGDQAYVRLQEQLATAIQKGDGELIGRLHGEMEVIDGYTIRSRATIILSGLGFAEKDHKHKVRDFSGGWRMRLNLAQALIVRSDLLLLDEPTNHLDLDAVIFLEEFLQNYPGTLVVISHDRDFLDRIVKKIIHIEDLKFSEYTSNYSGFEIMRAERRALQQASRERQLVAVAHMKSFIERFRYKASKAKQAQSRIKALEKMEILAPVQAESPFTFSFRNPDALPNPIIILEGIILGYGDHIVLNKVKMNIVSGSRIGLLGKNGAGKSTLIKCLSGELVPLSGKMQCSKGVKIGYFAQEQLEHLRLDESALKHMQLLAPDEKEQDLRTYLGSFAFSGDKVTDPVRLFSGGEKARLALALIVWQKPNLLLLDEPTNHLDLNMREALTFALQNYEGALIVVSHDRHLLRSTTDTLYLVDDGKVCEFDGDLDDYQKYLLEKQRKEQSRLRELKQKNSGISPEKKGLSRQEAKALQAQFRDETKNLRAEIARLDDIMEKASLREQEIQQELADNSLYDPACKSKLSCLLTEQGALRRQKEDAEAQWLELSEDLERRRLELDAKIKGEN